MILAFLIQWLLSILQALAGNCVPYDAAMSNPQRVSDCPDRRTQYDIASYGAEMGPARDRTCSRYPAGDLIIEGNASRPSNAVKFSADARSSRGES